MKQNRLKKFILLRVLAALLGIVAAIMIPALVMAAVTGEAVMVRAIALPVLITAAAAVSCLLSLKNKKLNLNAGDGYFLVFATWVLASFLGAFPFYLSGSGISFTDSLFESSCTFATTGGTTIGDIEALPRSLLLWRSTAHWFGGMGIVLISVALMPLLGVGGFQLIKAEAPGPEKEKITPKVAVTAKLLWLAYSVLTVVLFVLYLAGGMDWFDALCHSLTTMASGGVSTRNKGIAYFNSPFIDIVSTIFMLLAGLNFNLYYRLLQGKLRDLIDNTEARAYLIIFLVSSAIIALSLIPVYGSPGRAFRYASYQAASILSTTGAAITNYENWPGIARMVLFGLVFIGGCSSSTAGGIKVIRHVVLWKQMGNELRRAVYPRGVFSVQLNKRVGRKDVVYGVAGFVFLYIMVIMLVTLLTTASGVDVFSSLSAALSITGNVGVGFGAVGPLHNYGGFADPIKWLFSFTMIAGRLEMWTVFILFRPEYWRR
ncbi:MAG: TrkH family potassium uptake protein [Treponema sp.]|jgi:trk system potassium uptake protein TrkH|nr:TrkH family potassium uptake protein [Treponema sp.]